jgi:thymidylate synthase
VSRNVTEALTDVLASIDISGKIVAARGSQQREVMSTLINIDRPRERVLSIPHRNANVFAQIAETLWVLAGRDDLDFLNHYLPRAVDFSDDGKTWRAAYGPRLRAWAGEVDQLAEARARLVEDPHTKRAVLNIFDPARDYVETLDVPCNNWLHFLQRDGELHLSVAVRANDAIGGFSGINTFEWSVLHELMAVTLGWQVGKLSWFVGILHVYERHYETATKILRHSGISTLYEFGLASIPITIGLDDLDDVLRQVFFVEQLAREGSFGQAQAENSRICDPFFKASAVMLRAYNAFVDTNSSKLAFDIIDELPDSDFRIAAIEFMLRKLRTRTTSRLRPDEQNFLNYFWTMQDKVVALPESG